MFLQPVIVCAAVLASVLILIEITGGPPITMERPLSSIIRTDFVSTGIAYSSMPVQSNSATVVAIAFANCCQPMLLVYLPIA